MVLLTRRAVVQAAMESVYNTPAAVGANDGVLVADPAYTVEPSVLERNFVRSSLSPQAHIMGRLLAGMEFQTELRGNQLQHSGDVADAPIISRLFRACGYALTGHPNSSVIGVFDVDSHANAAAWAVSSGAAAAKVLTIAAGNAEADDTVTIGGVVYTFKVAAEDEFDVEIGADEEESATNLAGMINAGEGHPTVIAVDNEDGTVTVSDRARGTAGNSIAIAEDGTNISWAGAAIALSGGSNIASNTDAIAYYLECTTGGASAAAQITVTSDVAGEGNAAATVTTAVAFTLGSKGLTITPTFEGNLVAGQKWVVWLMPSGLKMAPISDDQESITLVMYKDGVKHTMPGAFGTFEVTATAGQFAMINWTFTGTYVAPVDASMPSPTYERTLPAQVELARLRVDGFSAVVEEFTFNQNNDIQIRPDVSSAQGYIGTRIVARSPEGGINPEAALVADHDFWGQLRAASRMPFQMRIGKDQGNVVWVLAPSTQYSGMTYADRNGILTYDAGLRFPGYAEDDEVTFFLH